MLSVFHAQPFFSYVMCVFTLILLQCCLSVPSRMRAEGYCSCRVCVSVCLSVCVCVSVTALATSVSAYIRKQRYTRVDFRLFMDFDSWILEKTFRSKVMA